MSYEARDETKLSIFESFCPSHKPKRECEIERLPRVKMHGVLWVPLDAVLAVIRKETA